MAHDSWCSVFQKHLAAVVTYYEPHKQKDYPVPFTWKPRMFPLPVLSHRFRKPLHWSNISLTSTWKYFQHANLHYQTLLYLFEQRMLNAVLFRKCLIHSTPSWFSEEVKPWWDTSWDTVWELCRAALPGFLSLLTSWDKPICNQLFWLLKVESQGSVM